ncbi:HU family DNA-binding protein [Lutibacter litoralis]|uniref:HU family DNA-binding protein n=1 Tax=Lutibacter litoralis TaxID=321268 RepID=A0ABV5K0A9_9FLAO|nr:HU family DNA-binding protein [Gramella jeungdoensis]
MHFKTITKTNVLQPKKPRKYYAQSVTTGEAHFKTLLQETAKACKMSQVDANRLYYNLEAIIQQELEAGKVVRLGGIGSFQIGISSNGYDTPKEVTSNQITKAKINYRPGKPFKEMLKALNFKKV